MKDVHLTTLVFAAEKGKRLKTAAAISRILARDVDDGRIVVVVVVVVVVEYIVHHSNR
jgi:hypothetical protein